MLKINWKTVRGTQTVKPATEDKTSSPSVVYLRKDIHKVLIEQNDQAYYAWEYEEAVLTLEEYAEYEELVAQVATPAMQTLQEQNTILMEALADIYERLENQEQSSAAIMSGLADLYELQEGALE